MRSPFLTSRITSSVASNLLLLSTVSFGIYFSFVFGLNSAHAQQTLTSPTITLNSQEGVSPNPDTTNTSSFQNDAEKFQRALAHWESLAVDGNAEAQYKTGAFYTNTQYNEPDLDQAIHWYTLAVEQNHSLAQYNLGHHYLNGIGVEKNIEKAIQLWLKAARQDHSLSQFNVGRAYYLGIGLPANLDKARFWFEKAADNDEAKSIALLEKIDWDTPTLKRAKTNANATPATNTSDIEQQQIEQQQQVDNETTQATITPEKQSITLYTNPKINAYPISVVDDNSEFKIIEQSGEWTIIQYNQGFPVWVHTNFVTVTGSLAFVTTDKVNTRTEPLIIHGNIVGQLNTGETLKVLANSKRWHQVTAPPHFKVWVKTSELSPTSHTKKSTPIENKKQIDHTMNHDQWLFQQDPERYTLQLTSLSGEDDIDVFLNQNKLNDDNNIHRFDSKKVESISTYLLYGSYKQKDDAERVKAKISNQDVWVRQFAKIQQHRCVTWKKQLPPPDELNKHCVPSDQ